MSVARYERLKRFYFDLKAIDGCGEDGALTVSAELHQQAPITRASEPAALRGAPTVFVV